MSSPARPERRPEGPESKGRAAATIIVALAASVAPSARADDEPRLCTSDSQCPGWQVCSVSLGDCGSGLGNADVCTGVCRAGWVAVAARAGALASTVGGSDGGAAVSAAFSLEVLPPRLDGRVSLAVDRWTLGAWRAGAAWWLRPRHALAAGLRLDGLHAGGHWHPAAAARLEWSPLWPWGSVGWLGHTSVLVELGTFREGGDYPLFASLSLSAWLRLP